MAKSTVVIDTDVLLHDPSIIERFADHDMLISVLVLEELERQKKNASYIGHNARSSLDAILRSITNSNIRICFNHSRRLDSFPFVLDKVSHRILHLAHERKIKGEDVLLLSKNLITRLKARSLNIDTHDEHFKRILYKDISRGIHSILVKKSVIDLFYLRRELSFDRVLKANHYYTLDCKPQNSSVICRYDAKAKKVTPLMSFLQKTWSVSPLNIEQRCAIDLLLRQDIHFVALLGPAGTGKTLLAVVCALYQVFDESLYNKILISRPILPLGRDLGYLPGSKDEKLSSWMQPIYDNLEMLCSKMHGIENMRCSLDYILDSKKIEFEAITYVRGRSLQSSFIIIDEAQNLNCHEMKTILSRVGNGSKIIITGDPTQIDNPHLDQDSNGLTYAVSKFDDNAIFGHVMLSKTERSKLAELATKLL